VLPVLCLDRAHLAEYHRAAQAGPDVFARDYLARYVFEPATHADYLERIGGALKRQTLESWKDNDESWRALFTAREGTIA